MYQINKIKKLKKIYQNYLNKFFPSILTYYLNNELLIIVNKNKLFNLLLFLKKHTMSRYEILIDIIAVDYPNKIKRFEINYQLLSLQFNNRINISTFITEKEYLTSVVSIYKAANWFEREVWDMFGIFFKNNNDLRRILTDYGFKGHPLRKDFPLIGYIEVFYNDLIKRIIYRKVVTTQYYRNFEFKLYE